MITRTRTTDEYGFERHSGLLHGVRSRQGLRLKLFRQAFRGHEYADMEKQVYVELV